MKYGCVLTKLLMVMIAGLASMAGAQSQVKTLYRFRGYRDGGAPTGGLVIDASGNLYGTTYTGGRYYPLGITCGTVFELSPTTGGGWKKKTIYEFTGGADGCYPTGSIAIDASGNLYGASQFGGVITGCQWTSTLAVYGCGTVWQLSPATEGWAESTIYTFTPSIAFRPTGIVRDANGNLFGTARPPGDKFGLVYELSPTGGGAWIETTLHAFELSDGVFYDPSLLVDSSGNLFGNAYEGGTLGGSCGSFGGAGGCGTVYELSPSLGGWSFNRFAIPSTNRGIAPYGSFVEDSSGHLFGVATQGGADSGGVVFELSPVAGGGWTESVIHIFGGNYPKGYWPQGLISDGSFGFYGITNAGGKHDCIVGCGVVFHLVPSAQGGWSEFIVHTFTGGYDEYSPNSLIRDASGNLYGTTQAEHFDFEDCGGSVCGTVFKIINAASGGK